VVLPDTAGITVKAITINPDAEITLVPGQTNTSGLSEDYTLKQPIRAKSHYCELQFETTANRPEIRNVSIEAAGQSLPPTETRNAA
jgi:broad specificity polyphosphatase/5'/3'-nucleotidase SurE